MSGERTYIVLSSSEGRCASYKLTTTMSDPYEHARVRSYDQTLRRTLSKIFRERRLSSGQIRKLIRAPRKHDDANKDSIFKLIHERQPGLGKLLLKRKKISLFWIAVLSCYQDSAELLLRSGADPNELYGLHYDGPKLTRTSSVLHALLLMYPSSWNERFVGLLISHGVDVKAQDSRGGAGLHFAVRHSRVKLAERLLEKGAVVDAAHCNGVTALHEAASTRKFGELLPLLVKYGADIAARDIHGRNVLLFLAWAPAGEDRADLARLLIEKGVSPREVISDQFQPIHVAAKNGKIELVKLYLDHGANVNAQGPYGEFPLYLAAKSEDPEMMLALLIKRGANIDLTARGGYTALHCLTSHYRFCWTDRNRVEKIRILLSVGADMFAESHSGLTPLDVISNKNMGNGLMLKTLALRRACLPPSIEFKEETIVMEYSNLRDYYRDYIEEIDRMKSTSFIKTCTFFELLTSCQCQIAPLMRHLEFGSRFRLYDLGVFPMFADDMVEAFERAEHYYRSVLDLENVIDEAACNTLPYVIVRKIAGYALNCEICELKKIAHASREYR